jgi:hypothetical protein
MRVTQSGVEILEDALLIESVHAGGQAAFGTKGQVVPCILN